MWGHSVSVVRGNVIKFGGYGNSKFTNLTAVYDPHRNVWGNVVLDSDTPLGNATSAPISSVRKTSSAVPTPRSNHAACVVADRFLLVIHGGGKRNESFNTYHALDTAADPPTWHHVQAQALAAKGTALRPCARSGHAACKVGDGTMVAVFGGKAGKSGSAFGGGSESGDVHSVKINALAESLKKEQRKNRALNERLEEYRSAVETLREQLTDLNLFKMDLKN